MLQFFSFWEQHYGLTPWPLTVQVSHCHDEQLCRRSKHHLFTVLSERRETELHTASHSVSYFWLSVQPLMGFFSWNCVAWSTDSMLDQCSLEPWQVSNISTISQVPIHYITATILKLYIDNLISFRLNYINKYLYEMQDTFKSLQSGK